MGRQELLSCRFLGLELGSLSMAGCGELHSFLADIPGTSDAGHYALSDLDREGGFDLAE